MKKINDYIIHRSIDMETLVKMVHEFLPKGYQPYGDLIAFPMKTNKDGVGELNGLFLSIEYIQAMVKYEN